MASLLVYVFISPWPRRGLAVGGPPMVAAVGGRVWLKKAPAPCRVSWRGRALAGPYAALWRPSPEVEPELYPKPVVALVDAYAAGLRLGAELLYGLV